jgi:phospholipid/cholesterol/gamma-HCH transport system permease protein
VSDDETATRTTQEESRGTLTVERAADGGLVVRLGGRWNVRGSVPSLAELTAALAERKPAALRYDTADLHAWDTSVLAFVSRVDKQCAESEIPVDRAGLPEGARRLLDMANRPPERPPAPPEPHLPPLERVGTLAQRAWKGVLQGATLIGDLALAIGRLFTGTSRMRRRDLVYQMSLCGAQALAIVALVNFLVGLVLAFVGAIQLESYGAQLYVADLVGIAMVREMGAMMTAIVVAGRTGAAFAAEIGTMQVTQEIDALEVIGVPTFDFLVLPRVLALSFMVPILTVFADIFGILGGSIVGLGMLGIRGEQYFRETARLVTISHLTGGVCKAAVYGVLVALAGCLRGLQSGRTAADVGRAATSAVVTGIVAIIVACGLFSVIFYVAGF